MRIRCPKCGAEHAVLESDFFIRCTYCDARIVVDPPASTPYITVPAVETERVRRLFPPESVLSMETRYFPYIETSPGSGKPSLAPCFSQPWQALETYLPPAGDRKLFDEGFESPEELIPFDRELTDTDGGRILFHPFYIVMLKLEGYSEGVLVDGVSGRLIGENPLQAVEDERGTDLYRMFIAVFAAGIVLSFPLFYILAGMGLPWAPRMFISFLTALGAGFVGLRIRDRMQDG